MNISQSFPIFIGNFNILKTVSILVIITFATTVCFAQALTGLDRGRAKNMLKAVKNELKDNYYDTTFRGMDVEARFKIAEEKLDSATTLGQTFGIIAQAVLELNDSHTTFYPPARSAIFEYGWRIQMIGDKPIVIAVKPKSDAEKKGLKVGDEVLAIEGFRPNRKEMWKINYYYNSLSPRNNITLKVISPEEKEPREINIVSKVTNTKAAVDFYELVRELEIGDSRKIENRFVKVGNTVIWKMPSFSIDPVAINTIMEGQIKNSSNLILDLRGNGGGLVKTLEELAGYFVEKDTKIADLKGRKKMESQMAKSKGDGIYRGKIIVLIDSRSASASEIFARFMQLEQRGAVVGDISAGAVMQSRIVSMQMGADSLILYGMSITNADVIMTDGASLEHIGVTPQVLMTPTGADVAASRDTVLAAALELFGETVTPEQAGKFFLYNWDED